MGVESQDRVLGTILRGDERARMTRTARRTNPSCGLGGCGTTRHAPFGEGRIFRLGFAGEVPRDEGYCDSEEAESDNC